jgi:hypothetical protein
MTTPIMPPYNSQLFQSEETLFTKTFANQIIKTVSTTGFLQMALKKVAGIVRFRGNGTKINLSINGIETPVDSDWVNIDDNDSVTLVSIDGMLDVEIDASAGTVKLMAIQ